MSLNYKPILQFNKVDERLMYWLRYYDVAYQLLDYEEYLDNDVIEDDLRLDAFFLYYDDKRKKDKEERIKEEKNREHENKSVSSKGMVSLNDIDIASKFGG